MIKVLNLLFVVAVCAAAANPAQKTAQVSTWARLDGPPNDKCIGPIYGINVAPDFTLLAISGDQRVSWAVMAGSRGLEIAACAGRDIHEDGFAGVAIKDPLKIASQSLVQLTKDATSSQQSMSIDDKARYSVEVTTLIAGLKAPLTAMIADAKRRYPGFPRKLPLISVPTP